MCFRLLIYFGSYKYIIFGLSCIHTHVYLYYSLLTYVYIFTYVHIYTEYFIFINIIKVPSHDTSYNIYTYYRNIGYYSISYPCPISLLHWEISGIRMIILIEINYINHVICKTLFISLLHVLFIPH